ncbi:hypothetical protein ACJX0J_025252, partial [Zea mays]
IAKNHQVRKQYTIQVGENELVLKELELLSDGANVYKLIGPVLVKQDLAEAKANVKKRIEYISAELKRMDRALKDLEEKQNSKKESIFKQLISFVLLAHVYFSIEYLCEGCFFFIATIEPNMPLLIKEQARLCLDIYNKN